MRIVYENQNGNSGISEVIIGEEHIDVEFKNGGIYRYSKGSVGETNLFIMKTLAQVGTGLNRFINKHVRNKYQNRFGFTNNTAFPKKPTPIKTEDAVSILTQLVETGKISLVIN